MKIKTLNPKQRQEVIDLECKNIIPILASVGIHLTPEMMVQEVDSFGDDEIILSEDKEGINGFVIFQLNPDHVLIKTFNLKKFNNFKILKDIFIQVVPFFEAQTVKKLKSQAHLSNRKSINFHHGLGFKEVSRNEKYIEFECTSEEFVQKINSCVLFSSRST